MRWRWGTHHIIGSGWLWTCVCVRSYSPCWRTAPRRHHRPRLLDCRAGTSRLYLSARWGGRSGPGHHADARGCEFLGFHMKSFLLLKYQTHTHLLPGVLCKPLNDIFQLPVGEGNAETQTSGHFKATFISPERLTATLRYLLCEFGMCKSSAGRRDRQT